MTPAEMLALADEAEARGRTVDDVLRAVLAYEYEADKSDEENGR